MACTTILAGKKATADGSTMIARSEDYIFSPKRLVIIEPEAQPRHYKTVTTLLEMDLPEDPIRYTATPNVDDKRGWWGAHGINAANVAMTATETLTANTLLQGADPLLSHEKRDDGTEGPGGIGEEDFLRIVLPYVRTAREGVLRLGKLLETYGTYERNGIAFCDGDEVWWLETIGGHHWYACRVPDDKVVLMPNRLGCDRFDLADAMGEGKDFLCSEDLKDFCMAYGLLTPEETCFSPREVFGTHSDFDRVFNNPRAWDMARFLCPTRYKWLGDGADFAPESGNMPWAWQAESKITPEEIKFLLSLHFQFSPWDPYAPENVGKPEKYRSVAVCSTNVSSILQIRPGARPGRKPETLPEEIRAIQWVSFGPNHLNAAAPFYTNVPQMPEYLTNVGMDLSSENFCWASRILAGIAEPHYHVFKNVLHRYQQTVASRARAILWDYDRKMADGRDCSPAAEANEAIAAMLKKETDSVIKEALNKSFEQMKSRD